MLANSYKSFHPSWIDIKITCKGNEEQFLCSLLNTEKRVTRNTKGLNKTRRRNYDNQFMRQIPIV